MFSHNGANKPESKITHTFRPVLQVAARGAKSAVSDCILFVAVTRAISGSVGEAEPSASVDCKLNGFCSCCFHQRSASVLLCGVWSPSDSTNPYFM